MKKKVIKNNKINWVETCTLFSTIATLALVVFTAFQIFRYGNSTRADFAHKIKIDFFNEDERTLIFLLNNDLLEFKIFEDDNKNVSYTYFSLNKLRTKFFQNDSINLLSRAKASYTTLEIEDILLNHFEDLNIYRINKVIGSDYLYNGFSSYVELVFENDQIQKLLNWLNSEPGINDSYVGFRELYKFLQSYEKEIYNLENLTPFSEN